jgi:hypothetical protein
MSGDYDAFNFPELDLPVSPPIIGIRTTYVRTNVYDDDGNIVDEVIMEGQQPIFDHDWKPEERAIYLMTFSNRTYYSIHQDYTMDILKTSFIQPDEDTPEDEIIDEEPLFDLKFEKKEDLSEDFTPTLLDVNIQVRTKYREDENYLDYLGVPQPSYLQYHLNPSLESVSHPPSMDPNDRINFDGPVITPEPEPVGIATT